MHQPNHFLLHSLFFLQSSSKFNYNGEIHLDLAQNLSQLKSYL